jgi:hypothetical protein
LFKPATIPAQRSVSVDGGVFSVDKHTGIVSQEVHIRNNGTTPIPAPVTLVLDNLSANATLLNADGTSVALAPLGSPYVDVFVGGDDLLRPHEVKTVRLQFADPTGAPITYDARVLDVVPQP